MNTFNILICLATTVVPASYANDAEITHLSENRNTATITLAQTLELALTNQPEIQLHKIRMEAQQGKILSAGAKPNPFIQMELENIMGSGPFKNTDSAEWTLGISYTLERAQKRILRQELSESENTILMHQIKLLVRQVIFQTRSDFYTLIIAQKRVEIRNEELALANRAKEESLRLVSSANISQVELTRAELDMQLQVHALAQAEMELSNAWTRLTANWGDYSSVRKEAVASVQMETIPDFNDLMEEIPNHPALEQFEKIAAQRNAFLELEKSKSKSDVNVFAGARYFNENGGDAALTVGMEIPWMRFDKNQGGIRSAQAEIQALHFEKAITLRELQNQLLHAHQNLVSAYMDAEGIKTNLIPAAKATLQEIQKAYDQGRFSLMSVLEAQKQLIELKEQHLQALERYMIAHNQIQELTTSATPR